MIYKKHSTFNYIKKLSFILLRHGCRGKTILLYIIFLTTQYAQYVDILLKVQISYYIVIFVISILTSRTLLNKRIGL